MEKRWTAVQEKSLIFSIHQNAVNKDCKEHHLEQIRFVMTCSNGHIHDLPWEYWNNLLPTDRTK